MNFMLYFMVLAFKTCFVWISQQSPHVKLKILLQQKRIRVMWRDCGTQATHLAYPFFAIGNRNF